MILKIGRFTKWFKSKQCPQNKCQPFLNAPPKKRLHFEKGELNILVNEGTLPCPIQKSNFILYILSSNRFAELS
jgi:hypothetical protein